MHKKTVFKGLILFFITNLISISHADTMQPLRLGSVAMDTPASMHQRLLPLTQYLSKELNRNVTLKLSPNMSEAINDVVHDRVDIAYLTPVAYIRSHAKGKTQLIVKTVTNNRASFKLMIVTGKNSNIKNIDDLKGKKFAFGDRAALLQRAIVVGADIPLEDFGSYEFLGHYDNIVRSVLHGDFDAGILKDTKALKWRNKGIRIVYESPELPPYNLAASKNINKQTLEKIRSALLSLDKNNPTHRKIIKSLDKKYDGFAATNDQEYDVIRKLVAPFAKK